MKKEQKKPAAIIVAAAVLACALPAAAQDTLTQKLGDVSVTATRSEKSASETGRSVTVITSEDIRRSGANTLSEVLSQQEGIYIVGTGQNFGMTQTLFTRGTSSNHTVLLIDGVRVLDPSSVNNAPDLSEISLIDIDRIEIVRGSHSTLYGSAAIGGVVNIITKKAGKPGLNVDASAAAGVFGKETSIVSENIALNYTARSGFYAGAELFNTSVNGLDATVDTNRVPQYNRDRDDFQKVDMVGKLGYRKNKLDVYFTARTTEQLTDIDKRAYVDDDNYTLDFNRLLLTYGASYRINGKLGLKYIGGLSDMKRIAVDDSSVVDNFGNTDKTYSEGVYKGSHMTNELQADVDLKGVKLVAGGGYYAESMDVTTYYYSNLWGPPAFELRDTIAEEASTITGFLHADISGELLNERYKAFTLSLGGRFNDHSAFGSYFTYEINPSVKLNNNALVYAAYTTGFNAPSLYQLYSPEKDIVSGITRGNPALDPESSVSYEFGVKQKLGKEASFSFAVFHTVTDNVIEYVYLWDKNIGIDTLGNDWMRNDYRGDTYINAGKQTSKGMEVGISSKLAEKLWISGNFSIIRGKLEYEPGDVDTAATKGNHVQLYSNGAFLNREVITNGLVRRPATANIELTWKPFEKLLLRADMRHVSAREDIYYESALGPYGALATVPVASYTLFDAMATVKFSESTSAAVRVENVFDVDYAEIKGFATRGRSAYVSVRYRF